MHEYACLCWNYVFLFLVLVHVIKTKPHILCSKNYFL